MAPVEGSPTDRIALSGHAHGPFSAIDGRASAAVLMVGLGTCLPLGDRASAAVLMVGDCEKCEWLELRGAVCLISVRDDVLPSRR